MSDTALRRNVNENKAIDPDIVISMALHGTQG